MKGQFWEGSERCRTGLSGVGARQGLGGRRAEVSLSWSSAVGALGSPGRSAPQGALGLCLRRARWAVAWGSVSCALWVLLAHAQ